MPAGTCRETSPGPPWAGWPGGTPSGETGRLGARQENDRPRRRARCPMRRVVAASAALVLAATLLAGCGGSHKLGKDEGRLKTNGQAFVARQGKHLKAVTGSTVLHAG